MQVTLGHLNSSLAVGFSFTLFLSHLITIDAKIYHEVYATVKPSVVLHGGDVHLVCN